MSDRSPSTKATLGSNSAHLTARFDPRTGWVVVIAALDNLVKGASGQAVQCANVLLGLPEVTGLPLVGIYHERAKRAQRHGASFAVQRRTAHGRRCSAVGWRLRLRRKDGP